MIKFFSFGEAHLIEAIAVGSILDSRALANETLGCSTTQRDLDRPRVDLSQWGLFHRGPGHPTNKLRQDPFGAPPKLAGEPSRCVRWRRPALSVH